MQLHRCTGLSLQLLVSITINIGPRWDNLMRSAAKAFDRYSLFWPAQTATGMSHIHNGFWCFLFLLVAKIHANYRRTMEKCLQVIMLNWNPTIVDLQTNRLTFWDVFRWPFVHKLFRKLFSLDQQIACWWVDRLDAAVHVVSQDSPVSFKAEERQ